MNAKRMQLGNRFQTAAAASLLIDYIYEFETIKNEGDDDIVITLIDGSVVYAQAKSSFDESSDNAIRYFKRAMKTLIKDAVAPKSHLVYITNIYKMLGSETRTDDFSSGILEQYSNLNEDNKKLVDKYAGTLPLDRFAIQYLKFTGTDDNKWTSLRAKLGGLFETHEALGKLSAKMVLNTWVIYLDNTASNEDTSTSCSREQIVWGMILHKIDRINNDYYNEGNSNYDRIQSNYDLLISKMTSRFDIISRISGDYQMNKDPSKRDSSELFESFAKLRWEDYIEIIKELDISTEDRPTVLIIMIRTILEKMEVIRSVKREMKIK